MLNPEEITFYVLHQRSIGIASWVQEVSATGTRDFASSVTQKTASRFYGIAPAAVKMRFKSTN